MQMVMNVAGVAGIAVCQLLMNYGFKNFIVCDTKRDIYEGRPENMNPFKNKIVELSGKLDQIHIFLRGGYIVPYQDVFDKYILKEIGKRNSMQN